jgi:hypothetical protein
VPGGNPSGNQRLEQRVRWSSLTRRSLSSLRRIDSDQPMARMQIHFQIRLRFFGKVSRTGNMASESAITPHNLDGEPPRRPQRRLPVCCVLLFWSRGSDSNPRCQFPETRHSSAAQFAGPSCFPAVSHRRYVAWNAVFGDVDQIALGTSGRTRAQSCGSNARD